MLARSLIVVDLHKMWLLQDPEASCDGLGGTYFFMNEAGRRAAIIKPCDEEPLAPNNPKVSSPPHRQLCPTLIH